MEWLRSAWGVASVLLALVLLGVALAIPACGDDGGEASEQTLAVLDLSDEAIALRDEVGDAAAGVAGHDDRAERAAIVSQLKRIRVRARRFAADVEKRVAVGAGRADLQVAGNCFGQTAGDLVVAARGFGRVDGVQAAARAGSQFETCNTDLRLAVESVQADAAEEVSLAVEEIDTDQKRYRGAFEALLAASRAELGRRRAAARRRRERREARELRRARRAAKRAEARARQRTEEQRAKLPPCSKSPPPCRA